MRSEQVRIKNFRGDRDRELSPSSQRLEVYEEVLLCLGLNGSAIYKEVVGTTEYTAREHFLLYS
jgi:hypothetical protein